MWCYEECVVLCVMNCFLHFSILKDLVGVTIASLVVAAAMEEVAITMDLVQLVTTAHQTGGTDKLSNVLSTQFYEVVVSFNCVRM